MSKRSSKKAKQPKSRSAHALEANEPEATTDQATKTVEQVIGEAQGDEAPEPQSGQENAMAAPKLPIEFASADSGQLLDALGNEVFPEEVPADAKVSEPEIPSEQATKPMAADAAPEAPPAKAKKAKKDAGPRKLSALDAAAQVLREAGQPMTCQEMVEAMSKRGLWSSPNGATPAATLYSAILRELKKGPGSRFQKVDRGKFAAKAS